MITVTVAPDGTGSVVMPGGSVSLDAATPEQAQAEAVTMLIAHAAHHGQTLDVQARQGDQVHQLRVHPDGVVTVTDAHAPAPAAHRPEPAPVIHFAPTPAAVPAAPTDRSAQTVLAGTPEHAARAGGSTTAAAPPPTSAAPATRREARQSFLTVQRVEAPATKGMRGLLGQMGIRIAPSAAERAERDDIQAVSQHWPGRRTIAVVNGKGGAGKTPSTILLAAVFARYGGAGVLAWDHNQTRGTLGWRTEQGPHQTTLLDLLPEAERLRSTSAQAADIARYVHHQTEDRYDVLRSKPMALAADQRLGVHDVDVLHSVAAKYYRIILMDSGNDESDAMWGRMIDLTDQIVVATTTRDDHAEAGALLLEGLAARDARSAALASQAVVVVSQADRTAPAGDAQRVAAGYASLARDAVTIPFDPAIVGGHLRFASLRPATQRAWLAAGAAVARGL